MIAATFFTGKPCRNGHVAPRLVSNKHCVPCSRKRHAKYKATHRAEDHAYQVMRRKLHKDRLHAQGRAWRQRHPEKVRAKTAAYQRANPIRVATYNHRRLARKANAPGRGVTVADWQTSLTDSLGLCAYCGYQRNSLEMDHIDPLSLGGAHDPENVAPACMRCNRTKNDRPLLVWLAKEALLRSFAA